MNISWKRIIIWGLVCWGVLPFIIGPIWTLLEKAGDSEKTEKTSATGGGVVPSRYDSFFEGDFSVKLSPGDGVDDKKRMVFFKDGTAVLQHDRPAPVLDFYTYEPVGDGIRLKGEGVVTVRLHATCLSPGIPDDITLQAADGADGAILKGSSGKGGRTYTLCPTEGRRYGRIPMKAFDALRSGKSLASLSPDSLWVVKADGVVASTGKNAGKECKRFGRGELVYGGLDPKDGAYVRLPYIQGRYAYVDVRDVEKVGTSGRLTELLAEDGLRGMTLLDWTKEFDDMEWENDTRDYFNGWRAGRPAVEFFFCFMGWMLLILLLDRTYGWFSSLWPFVGKATLVVLTLTELWYVGSLGLDAFWFFSELNPLVMAVAFISLSALFVLQSWLLYAVEDELYFDNDTYSSVPRWVEYALVIVLPLASVPLAIAAGNAVTGLGMFVIYGALMLATLPSTISLHRHSNKSRPMVLFLLICEPMRYVIILFGLIAKVFAGVASMKDKFEGPSESDTVYATDMDGNTVCLRRLSDDSFMDKSGNLYGRSGDSFYPLGPGDSRPFQK